MNKLLVLAASSAEIADSAASTAEESLGMVEALSISGLGFGIVFAVLVVLMVFITVMSAILRAGKKAPKAEKAESPVKAEAPVKVEAPVAAPAPVASVPGGEADMFVTVNGKKHAVCVEEKIPRFTVTVNGKAHGVDVESVEEE